MYFEEVVYMEKKVSINGVDYYYDDKDDLLGVGSSFISYKAKTSYGRPYILKIPNKCTSSYERETIIASGDYRNNSLIDEDYMRELSRVLYDDKDIANMICHFSYYIIDGDVYALQDYNSGIILEHYVFWYYEEICDVVKSIISFITKIHRKGWLILDLKPSNFLVVKLQDKLMIKLIDFDSLISKEKLYSDDIDHPIKTTIKYASPEVKELKELCDQKNYHIDENKYREYKQKIDENSDLYSIGIILKEILSKNCSLYFHSNVDNDDEKRIKNAFEKIVNFTHSDNISYRDKLSNINFCLESMENIFSNNHANSIYQYELDNYLKYRHDDQVIDYLLNELSSKVNKKIVAIWPELDDSNNLDDMFFIKSIICEGLYVKATELLGEMKQIFSYHQSKPLLLVNLLLLYIDIDTREFLLFDNGIKPEINSKICELLSIVNDPLLSSIYEYIKTLYLIKIGDYSQAQKKLPESFANECHSDDLEHIKIHTQVLLELAYCAKALLTYDVSIKTFENAIDIATKIDDLFLIFKSEIGIVECLHEQSKYNEAQEHIHKLFEITDSVINEYDTKISDSLLASLYSLVAINTDYQSSFLLDGAIHSAGAALVYYKHKKADENLIKVLLILAKCYIDSQSIKDEYLNKAKELLDYIPSMEHYIFQIKLLSSIHSSEHFEKSLDQSFDDLAKIGESLKNHGNYVQAIDYLQKAKIKILVEEFSEDEIFYVLFNLAYSLHMCKKYEEAIENYDLALYCTEDRKKSNVLLFNIVISYYYSGNYKDMFSCIINTDTRIDTSTYSKLIDFLNDHINNIVLNFDNLHEVINEISEKMDKINYDSINLNDKIIIDLDSLVKNKIIAV